MDVSLGMKHSHLRLSLFIEDKLANRSSW